MVEVVGLLAATVVERVWAKLAIQLAVQVLASGSLVQIQTCVDDDGDAGKRADDFKNSHYIPQSVETDAMLISTR